MLSMAGVSGRAEQMSVREYGQADGLDNLTVRALAQDPAGFLWIGTDNGLFRFDGTRFDRIGREQGLGAVSALSLDAAGRLWVGLQSGLWVWEKNALREVRRDGKRIPVVLPLAFASVGADRLWVVSDWRLLEFITRDGGRNWQVSDGPRPAQSDMADISSAVLHNGDLWMGCGRALCRLHDNQVEPWGSDRGVPGDHWYGLLRDRKGALWARGSNRVVELAAGAAAFVDRTDAMTPPDPSESDFPLAEDAQGRILTSAQGRLLRWNGQRWQHFTASSGLPQGGKLRALLADRDGGLWMGMAGGGLLQWRGYGLWQNWSTADGLAGPVVWALKRGAGGRLYAATGDGLSMLDETDGRFVPVQGEVKGQRELSALEDDGAQHLWVASSAGVVLPVRQGPATGQPAGVKGLPAVYRMRRDTGGTLWMATEQGLYRWSPGAGKPVRVGGDADAALFVDLCEDRSGAMWFAGEKGLFHHAGGQLARRPMWGADGQEYAAGLSNVACLRDGTFIVADTEGGLRQLRMDGTRVAAADVTPTTLNDRRVLALLEDSRGWLWAASDNGIAVRNGKHWRTLTQRQGLVWNDASMNALYEDGDGSIWVGTSRGISRMVAPQALFAPAALPQVRVQSATHEGQVLPTDRLFSLPPTGGALEIVLSAPLCCDPTARTLEYRLAGLDAGWTRSPHPDLRLSGLAPGHYRFEARVADLEREQHSQPVVLEFGIEPPWWATRTFYLASVLALLAAMALAYRWRVHALLQRRQELERLVAERTRELEASHEQMRELATRDGLTGAWNRRALMEIGTRELLRAQREGRPLTLVLADIDHFKRINDGHGHPAGDAVLREFVRRLVQVVRPYDAVGRYGGEEFVLVLLGASAARPEDRARLSAIHACVAASPFALGNGQSLTVTCSFGVASLSQNAPTSIEDLIAAADAALYRAKHAGRDRIEYA
jgi:diguanylate cyclase (GGDEF)-like protein